ncbi:hypothetical protein FRB99_008558 [Tulasnella sp. 403]|nr:hypothetical protein FRB99_008558 [Tulasnella sp. 403]
MPRHALSSLAVELIQNIAFYVALDTPTIRPPQDLLNFLLLNRHFHSLLDISRNSSLYSRIFAAQFDTSAIYRRFPPSALTAPVFAAELKRRWEVLKRIRAKSWSLRWTPYYYPRANMIEDLMTIYLMFTESDGRNALILLNFARVGEWLDAYFKLIMTPQYYDPKMPEETEETALWLWNCWFTLDYEKSMTEPEGHRVRFEFELIPYLMGTWKYPHAYAPWHVRHLPLPPPSTLTSSMTPSTSSDGQSLGVPLSLSPRPTSKAFPRGYLAHPQSSVSSVQLSVPLAHHAAILLYMARVSDRPAFPHGVQDPEVLPDFFLTDEQLLQQAHDQGTFPSFTTLYNNSDVDLSSFTNRDPYTPSYMHVRYAAIANSKRWDAEFARLVTCRDPFLDTPGELELGLPASMRYKYTPGSFSGIWDGRTMIITADSFHQILTSPDDQSLNLLEDAFKLHALQSWSITEYHFSQFLSPSSSTATPIRPGHPLNAHLPDKLVIEKTAAMWYDCQSGRQRWKDGITVKQNGTTAFYEEISSPADGETHALPDTSAASLPILIVGHAIAPPSTAPEEGLRRFQAGSTMCGTIRPWDGLITLSIQSSEPDRFGSWIWSGYLVGGGLGAGSTNSPPGLRCAEGEGNFIGRQREPTMELGRMTWEGVFCMSKRL